jgi:hypothetical protein
MAGGFHSLVCRVKSWQFLFTYSPIQPELAPSSASLTSYLVLTTLLLLGSALPACNTQMCPFTFRKEEDEGGAAI